jgi:hypothetical protein
VANTILNPSVIAKTAVTLLENELVAAKQVYRGYEDEFDKKVNGYPVGSTISIRKPTQFTVRSGATASIQDVVEGVETFTIDTQIGVDFNFTSVELTLQIEELSERVLRPAMIRLANQIDVDVLSLYKGVYNWVGTPGQNIDAFSDFAKGPERLDLQAVPQGQRRGVISPSDKWALAGSQTALALPAIGTPAYRKGSVGMVADVDLYMTQNVVTHTVGSTAGTPLVNGASQNVTYATAKATESVPGTQTLITDGWTASGAVIKEGDVFTIASVFAVNPVTKATLPYLQQFVARADGTADGSGNLTITIAPAIITSGAFQTVSAAPADNAAITRVGTAATGYPQNMVFDRNAFGLVIVPMVKPPGAVDVARESYNGVYARMIPYYSGSTDVSAFRLDILYGKKVLDPRLATRISGT